MSLSRGERQAINDLPRWKNERKRERGEGERGASRNGNSAPIHTSMDGQTYTAEQLALTVFSVKISLKKEKLFAKESQIITLLL